ncbi:hypothetical protein SAY86_031040 [Trapa natans]|uniref:Uncharacterized protein n=1 Tax=Trapa natans TaxID=22666 RepID=A0AAN7M4P5_TRANT|nr:hypothetical protein SAY86_031040 [Trapa natans]
MMYEQHHPTPLATPQQPRAGHHQQLQTRDTRAADALGTTEEQPRLEIVDLSGLSLETLPSPSLNLGIIYKLDLSNNNLQSIPESLTARLVNVMIFDVHSNQLKSIPNSIGCLSKLKVLNVSGNLIESFPKTIVNCKSLEELNANFNKLSKLPNAIGFELTNLRKLSVNSNKLVLLPQSLPHLTALRVLDARLNCLRFIPDNLENLVNLEVLNVSQNFQYLEALPYSIGLLTSVIELDLSYNSIKVLPDSLGCMRRLQKLRIEGNPLVSPPMDVAELGLRAVKEYLSERMKSSGRDGSQKKRSWIRKLIKYGTFNGSNVGGGSGRRREDREGFVMSDYRSIDGLASPRYMGMFSPRRLFSPRPSF